MTSNKASKKFVELKTTLTTLRMVLTILLQIDNSFFTNTNITARLLIVPLYTSLSINILNNNQQ